MKLLKQALELGPWSIWLSGFFLIALSLHATQMLPSLHYHINRPTFTRNLESPRITIFSAPDPSTGPAFARQTLVVRSWLALSPQITVVLFSQDPTVVSFAGMYGSRVVVDPEVDFTFLGIPFFHSMVARSQAFTADVSVFVDPESILLPDFISTLNCVHKFDYDWLLVASTRNVSHLPIYLDKDGVYLMRDNGKQMRTHEFQEVIDQNFRWNHCDERVLIAWNNGDLPLHSGVIPPFLYRKGIHNRWIINEAILSGYRFVFDASLTITSFNLDDFLDVEKRNWEYIGNFHLGTLYGSSFFHETKCSRLPKLCRCKSQYLFVDTANIGYSGVSQRPSSLMSRILHLSNKKKQMDCLKGIQLMSGLDCSLKDQFKQLRPLSFPYSLESLLQITADSHKTIVLGIAGYSYRDMLMSWVCRLRHLPIRNFLVCALDRETFEFSVMQGLPVFYDPQAPSNISFNDCHFGTDCFKRVTKVKSRIVLKILKLGYNVLLSDVDVYWFANPLPTLRSFGPGILAAQSDEYNETGPINLPRRLNSGFYFAYSDDSTIAAMEKVVKHATASDLSEQPSFYDTLCGEGGSNRVGDNTCLEPGTNLTVHFLNRDLFPNGAYLGLWQKRNVKAACLKKGCLVLHNNWISGRIKKLERQLLSGLWDYDISERMCLHN